MNNKINYILLLWLISFSTAFAEIPKAIITAKALNNSFPVQYDISILVPQDHHAYLDNGVEKLYVPISFDNNGALNNIGLIIDKLDKPAGSYDDSVKATVLRGQGDFKLTLNNTKPLNINNIDLAVRYQLCNDITHVCFRPQTAQVNLNLPIIVKALDTETEKSFSDSLITLFKTYHDNTLLIFALMFLAGLLSVATPCVYPMLPITSMFIINRANGIAKKEKQHAFVYLIGIITTYMALGLIAGMTGGAFNTFMQSAYVNLAFAIFFAFFAISLLGFYELSFMQSEVHSLDQQTARVKGLTGTLLMGTVAGLVISPCVGPIVFALLLQVADNIAQATLLNENISLWQRFIISAQGSLMMAGFGLGVGLPFFVVSVVKFKKLPKAGYWMNKIKMAFGLAILYFAYVYLEKGMGVLGISNSISLALAIGLAIVWFAVVHCNILTLLPSDAQPNEKMHRYLGVMTLLIGAWLVISSLGRIPLLMTAQANTPVLVKNDCSAVDNHNVSVEQEAGINWYRQYDAAQKLAQQTGKPIFIDFYASWCANCTAFKKETESNLELNRVLKENTIALKLIDKESDFEKFRENPQHRALKIGLPYFAILAPDGHLLWSSTDYTATKEMIAVLTKGTV